MTGKVTPKRLPKPRTMLGWDGTDFFALRVDNNGHLQIDVLGAALPDGAATEAKQDTEIATLGLIATLWNCLRTVGTDRFMVKGEDQLFSYKAQVYGKYTHTKSGAGNYTMLGAAVDPGEIWVVTTLMGYNWNTAIAAFYLGFRKGEVDYWGAGTGTLAAKAAYNTYTPMILVEGDKPAALFYGCADGDPLSLYYNGYSMTLET